MNLPFQIDLSRKTAVVTGAGGVLCSGFSKALAACGARVALLDINQAAAQKYADEITAAGGTAKAYECDVLNRASVEAAHTQIATDFGACDILLNLSLIHICIRTHTRWISITSGRFQA